MLSTFLRTAFTLSSALDFPENSFHAVLSRWALMFLVDLPGTLVRVRKILAPGGRLAAAVLGARENNSVALTIDIIQRMLQIPPQPGLQIPFG
jgi:ubiquinone/menaquinone biosynthesis C-methylase UbiE